MIKKSILRILILVVMLIITGTAHADVDCNTVTGAPPGLTGLVPVSFTFNSLNYVTEIDHGPVQKFEEGSVWELGGGLTGLMTITTSVTGTPKNETAESISNGKVTATDVSYQGRSGGISGTFIGRVDGSTGNYEEFDIWQGEGGLSGLHFKLYIPVQEFSTTPDGNLIVWGCATIQ